MNFSLLSAASEKAVSLIVPKQKKKKKKKNFIPGLVSTGGHKANLKKLYVDSTEEYICKLMFDNQCQHNQQCVYAKDTSLRRMGAENTCGKILESHFIIIIVFFCFCFSYFFFFTFGTQLLIIDTYWPASHQQSCW